MGQCTKTLRQENVVFVLDVSGSMQVWVHSTSYKLRRIFVRVPSCFSVGKLREVYLEDVKSAVNLALVQQSLGL